MYEEIDATASVMGNSDDTPEPRKLREMRTQTKRFTPKGLIYIVVLNLQVISLALHHHPIIYRDQLHQKALNKKQKRKRDLGFSIQVSGICTED